MSETEQTLEGLVKYARKPFEVEAIQVTADNMATVASWCDGRVTEAASEDIHIKVDVVQTMNERQTKAFVGDWVLKSTTGFKVYTDKAFRKSFDQKTEEVAVPVG